MRHRKNRSPVINISPLHTALEMSDLIFYTTFRTAGTFREFVVVEQVSQSFTEAVSTAKKRTEYSIKLKLEVVHFS